MGWFFMQIVNMQWIFYTDYQYAVVFMLIVAFKISFSMKRGYVYVQGTCKNV